MRHVRSIRKFDSDSARARAPAAHPGENWLRGLDLNQRPSGYEPDELPGCSTPRLKRTQGIHPGLGYKRKLRKIVKKLEDVLPATTAAPLTTQGDDAPHGVLDAKHQI